MAGRSKATRLPRRSSSHAVAASAASSPVISMRARSCRVRARASGLRCSAGTRKTKAAPDAGARRRGPARRHSPMRHHRAAMALTVMEPSRFRSPQRLQLISAPPCAVGAVPIRRLPLCRRQKKRTFPPRLQKAPPCKLPVFRPRLCRLRTISRALSRRRSRWRARPVLLRCSWHPCNPARPASA